MTVQNRRDQMTCRDPGPHLMEVLSLSTYYELINMTSYINYILFYKIVFYITKHVTEPQMELMMVM